MCWKKVRDYYETGCLCVLSGKVPKLSNKTDDWNAAMFYQTNCKCSRKSPHDVLGLFSITEEMP